MAGAVRRRNKNKPSRQNSSTSSLSGHAASSGRPHKNISLCLARGATARNLHPTLLQPLSADDMEKDLRHMQAYAAAVKSYQQQFYLQHKASQQSGDNAAAAVPLVPLPVRIDPEEEKRLVNLRKKIARAEVIREEAEQHYVASRAHYVHTVQDLEKTSQERFHIMEFMQKLIASRAHVVACQRARLQMARDIKDCLQARIDALQHWQDLRQAQGEAPTPFVPHLTGDDPLTSLWSHIDEEYKKAVAGCFEKRKKPLVWPATHLEGTPPGIPALLSAASVVPDKSVAWQAKGLFGCKDSSLVWTDGHLPLESVEESEEDTAEVERLERQVARLEQELDKERRLNQQVCQRIGSTRARNDEWVAMMCILRQETEAVLHRHNTILQSDQAIAAAQRVSELEEKNQGKKTSAPASGKGAEATEEPGDDEGLEKHGGAAAAEVKTTNADDAVLGDDERSNNEEDEEDWNSNKRAAAEDADGTTRGKRRRL